MPRLRPPVEHNIVQNPALTRALQQFTGTRQAHIAPALTDGMSPTIIVGDLRADPRTQVPASFTQFKENVPDGININRNRFINPTDSSRIAVLRRFHIFEEPGGAVGSHLVYNLTQDVDTNPTTALIRGRRLQMSYSGIGTAPVPDYAPPDQQNSRMGWKTGRTDGTAGLYMWQSPFGSAAGYPSSINEDFFDNRGPRIAMWPGSIFEAYVLDANSHNWVNIWWDEYPLT
jgi:hypothetical protein